MHRENQTITRREKLIRLLGIAATRVGVGLALMRLLAPAPAPTDPPDMRAFYYAWMQPSWCCIVALLLTGLLLSPDVARKQPLE